MNRETNNFTKYLKSPRFKRPIVGLLIGFLAGHLIIYSFILPRGIRIFNSFFEYIAMYPAGIISHLNGYGNGDMGMASLMILAMCCIVGFVIGLKD